MTLTSILASIAEALRPGIIVCALMLSVTARAQMDSALFVRDYDIREENVGELHLEFDNISFFKDNEWNGSVVSGYTLPGLWFQPKVVYTAAPELRLEAGMHTLLYSGTTKYPNTIYQDIAQWKGEQYFSGTHLIPFFRANIQLSNLHLVLGNLYGGSNHGLSDAMFSSELNLTSDPEMGLQMIYDNRRLHYDMWVNWQSFIFKGDFHQESFVFGISTRYKLAHNLHLTASALAHHRGGEIDTITVNSVNTVMNGSFGVRYHHPTPHLAWMRSWSLGADILGYYQESGKMWPKDKGWALYGEGRIAFAYGINAKVAYMMNHDYISILSYPYYGCMAVDGTCSMGTYRNPALLNAQVDWTHVIRRNYAIGIRAEMFQYFPNGSMRLTDGSCRQHDASNSLSFGVFVKANPSFLLKKR